MMDKMKDMKTKKRTLKKEEKKESETEYGTWGRMKKLPKRRSDR